MKRVVRLHLSAAIFAAMLCFSSVALAATASLVSFATLTFNNGYQEVQDMFKITDVAPWDLGWVDITLPDSSTETSPVAWKASYIEGIGQIYYNLFSPFELPIADGEYSYSFSEQDGTPIPLPDTISYIRNDLPVVTGLTDPANETYTNSTTPTFQWVAPDPALYYQVVVKYYDDWSYKWTSPILPAGTTSYAIPADILENYAGYRWGVIAYDQPTLEASRNISVSDTNKFFTGSGGGLPADINELLSVQSRLQDGRSPRTNFYIQTDRDTGTVIDIAPWDTTISITGPGISGSLELGENRFWERDYGYSHSTQLPPGVYTFTVTDTRDSSTRDGIYNFTPNWDLPILDATMVYQVHERGYVHTDQPTFEWASLPGVATYWKVGVVEFV